MDKSGEKWIKYLLERKIKGKRRMFIGEYKVSMDAKGRIPIPAKFRQLLNGKAVITRGLDKSLFLYPVAEWEKIAGKVSLLPLTKSDSRAFARLMLAGAFDFEMDKQGRAMIPEYLRKFAQLAKKVVCIGIYNRIEVWDEQVWEVYKSNTERESSNIAESLSELGV